MSLIYVKGFFSHAKELVGITLLSGAIGFGAGYYIGYDYGRNHTIENYKKTIELFIEKKDKLKDIDDITRLFD